MMLAVRTIPAAVDARQWRHRARQYCGKALNALVKQWLSPSARHRCRACPIAASAGSQVTTPSDITANAAPAAAG